MAVGAVDEDGIGERNVEAVFDDRGRDKHVILVVHKGEHHALKFGFAHLPVADNDARRGNQLLNARSDFVDGFDAVVHEVNLAAAFEFEFHSGAHDLFVELGDDGLNRHAVFGRRLDNTHVAQADERHVQGARDRCGAHCQYVDFFAHLLESFLVAHAEALLLIDDKQTEVLELDVFREQAVSADEDVHVAVFDALDNDLLLLGRAEARDHFDVDGELRKATLERLEMLEAENGGGRKDRDLLAVLHGLECSAHGHFGFAVAHIAAEQAVHGRGRFHVVLDGADGGELVVGFAIVEGVFKFLLEFIVLGEGSALRGGALGIELEQFTGHVLHGFAHSGLGLDPLLRTEFVEHRGGAGVGGAVFLDQVKARERDVELGLLGEFQDHELDRERVLHDFFEALILRDAVLDVDDIVADGEVAKIGDEGRGLRALRLGARGNVGVIG